MKYSLLAIETFRNGSKLLFCNCTSEIQWSSLVFTKVYYCDEFEIKIHANVMIFVGGGDY